MNLSALAALSGIVSAVSVLISLLLVRRQILQSEKNQRALIQQGRAGRSADIVMRLMSSDFADAYHNCMNGNTDITETQLVQFIGYCRGVFLGAEDSFLQHREHLLDDRAFNSFRRSLHGIFVSPGMRAAWSILREWYDGEFMAFVDSIVKEATGLPQGIQNAQWQHARWRAAVTTEASCRKAA